MAAVMAARDDNADLTGALSIFDTLSITVMFNGLAVTTVISLSVSLLRPIR